MEYFINNSDCERFMNGHTSTVYKKFEKYNNEFVEKWNAYRKWFVIDKNNILDRFDNNISLNMRISADDEFLMNQRELFLQGYYRLGQYYLDREHLGGASYEKLKFELEDVIGLVIQMEVMSDRIDEIYKYTEGYKDFCYNGVYMVL